MKEALARAREDGLVARLALSESALMRLTALHVELVVRARGWGAEDPARVARRALEKLLAEVLDP